MPVEKALSAIADIRIEKTAILIIHIFFFVLLSSHHFDLRGLFNPSDLHLKCSGCLSLLLPCIAVGKQVSFAIDLLLAVYKHGLYFLQLPILGPFPVYNEQFRIDRFFHARPIPTSKLPEIQPILTFSMRFDRQNMI